MFKKLLLCSIVPMIVVACGGGGDGGGDDAPPPPPQLFAQTNNAENSVLVFSRNADGTLVSKSSVPTNGRGTAGLNYFAGNTIAPDSLTSNNSVVLDDVGGRLFVANAGDNTVSVFGFDRRSRALTLLAVSPTGGVRPTSLAVLNDVLYVNHQVGAAQLAAFRVLPDGKLTNIGRYTVLQPDALATEVSISPNGKNVVVNGFLRVLDGPIPGNSILSYPINADGTLGETVATATLGVGPFGGRFAHGALSSVYVLTEAAGGTASSYRYDDKGTFRAVSGPVDVTGQAAPCWVSITPDNRYVYVSNGAGTISSFALDGEGKLTLLNALAATEPSVIPGVSSFANDSWISRDGKFLYQDYSGANKIVAYAIRPDGSLSKLGEQPAGTTSNVSLQGLTGS